MRPQTILVPLDGRRHSLAALPVATTLADAFDATLHLLHVGERTRPPRDMVRKLGLDLDALHGAVIDQATGPPAGAIERLAYELPDPMIVMCTHTGVDKPRGALGSVAEAVLCSVTCPLILVPPERALERWTLRRILLPHDGSPASTVVMDPAGEIAERTGAEILVLHVAATGETRPPEPGTITAPRYMDQPQHEWPAWAAEFVERMTALGHPPAEVRFRLAMAAGEPGREIVRLAREEDVGLVTLAWHGHWPGERALTLKHVIREAERPVLVVCISAQQAAG